MSRNGFYKQVGIRSPETFDNNAAIGFHAARSRIQYLMWMERLTLDDWDEDKEWPSEVLEHFGTMMLKAHGKLQEGPHPVFDRNAYKHRLKTEIYLANGDMDAIIAPGLYWRTHPNGRKVNTPEQRKRHAAGYYR